MIHAALLIYNTKARILNVWMDKDLRLPDVWSNEGAMLLPLIGDFIETSVETLKGNFVYLVCPVY
jgi:hypothetical protein